MKVLIYSSNKTARLEYAARILLKYCLGTEVDVTVNLQEFTLAEEIKINYSADEISNSLNILPASLLFESSIHKLDPLFSTWNNLPVLFYNPQNFNFPFDPFAAAFWMATRYEEYLPFEPDKHGRFTGAMSLAFSKGFLSEPVVHLWADSLKLAIKAKFPHFEPGNQKFYSLSTIDVDSAWKYLHKGYVRTTGAFARDLLSGQMKEIFKRLKTFRGSITDPFSSYSEFAEIHQEMFIVPQWFFLMADYSKYDINIDPQNRHFQNLIRELALQADIGFHPSYKSGNAIGILQREKSRLEAILKYPVGRSRQHFLKLSFPETYRRLIKIGIREDYSLGYHDQPGFRAGICIPYPWFDLEINKEETLTIVPFHAMDRTFTEYLHVTPDQAFDLIKLIIDKIIRINGQFVSIWHNEPADPANARGWFEVYRRLQKYMHEVT
jgi:hypothetical protein